MGSIYQLFMRYGAPFPRYQYFNVGLRGNNILFWLAVADLFSCMGKDTLAGFFLIISTDA